MLFRRGAPNGDSVESSLKRWDLLRAHFQPHRHWLPWLNWPGGQLWALQDCDRRWHLDGPLARSLPALYRRSPPQRSLCDECTRGIASQMRPPEPAGCDVQLRSAYPTCDGLHGAQPRPESHCRRYHPCPDAPTPSTGGLFRPIRSRQVFQSFNTHTLAAKRSGAGIPCHTFDADERHNNHSDPRSAKYARDGSKRWIIRSGRPDANG